MNIDNSNNNNIPDLCCDKRVCCGCTACYSVCPVSAITMKEDNEGFLYPEIDGEKCIHCNRCINICAFRRDRNQKEQFSQDVNTRKESVYTTEPYYNDPIVFAAKHKDEEIISKSRSGGVFTAVSDYILSRQGIIYGCILDDELKVKHVRADGKGLRDRMRGSKYVQSDLNETFNGVKEDLSAGRTVLFTGTSCQIAGLRSFIGHDNNLICIDILCHSVTSDKVFKKYIAWQNKRLNGEVYGINFRDKSLKTGWKSHIETLYCKTSSNNTKIVYSNVLAELYYHESNERPGCYYCPYKGIHRPGDITIGDFWGINESHPEFSDNKGVSLVFVNTDLGRVLFEHIKSDMNVVECEVNDVFHQTPLKGPISEPADRAVFWRDLDEKPFSYVAKKYSTYGFKHGLKKYVYRFFSKIKGVAARVIKPIIR